MTLPRRAYAAPLALYINRMLGLAVTQAVFRDGTLDHSPDFRDEWRSEITRIVTDYGLPDGTSAPESLLLVPFGRKHVAVVTVAGRRFRFLILSRRDFGHIPDPFAIAERFANDSDEPLRTLEWPMEALPRRTVAQLDALFKAGDGPLLLGACQTLVDSGRIALVRETPDAKTCRDVWMLLPDSIRRQTWLATFSYSLPRNGNLVVLPSMPAGGLPRGYLTEDQARDYPESRYERELQTAVEHNDQATVDRLFARRSSAKTLRLAVWIVLAAAALSVGVRLLMALGGNR